MTRIAACLLLLAGGCLDAIAPATGDLQQPTCSSEDSDPAHDIDFEHDIRIGLFARSDLHCVRCHTPEGATPIGLQIGGLDLSSLASLRRGGVQSGANIVVDADPCASVLVQKLGPAPPFGARMPFDGPPYMSLADRQLIEDWIAEGAHGE